MRANTRLTTDGKSLAGPLSKSICDLYDEVFARPPFHWRDNESELHRQRLARLMAEPSFGIAVANMGDELAGFAYGYTLSPDTALWTELIEPVPAHVAKEWPGRTFVLFDFAVRQAYRGRGIGRALHDRLLGSRGEERATLTVQPTAVDTKAIYEHWGWRRIGEVEGGPTGAAPMFDVYLRDNLNDLRAAGHASE